MIKNNVLVNKEVRIENTSQCNAQCVICPRDQMTRPKVTMPLAHFRHLVIESVNLGAETISVFGYGEPTVDTTLTDKIACCTAWGMKTFITSNGSLLTPRVTHRLLEVGLSHIRFSCHGIDDKYEKVHRPLKFWRVKENIDRFIEVNNKMGHPCRIDMSVIPMHRQKIDDIRAYWEPVVDNLEIWRPHAWAGAMKILRNGFRRKDTCGRPFSGPVQINADGKIMVCCFDFDARMTVGDTYKNTIKEIITGREMELIRNKHRTGDLTGLPCGQCDQLYEYDEDNNPLLYSTVDPSREINKTSSTKFKLEV